MIARRRPATTLAVAQAAIGVAGTFVAMLLAGGTSWLQQTVSHLTDDPVAGPWFRIAMAACGGIGLALAWAMWRILGRLRAGGRAGARWAALHRLCFVVIPLGFLGVAAFPLGVTPLVELAHGTAAYAIPIAVLVLMLTARLAVPELGDRFGRASLALIAAILLLYATAVFGLMPYAPMELAGFGIGGAWLVAYVRRLELLAVARDGQGAAETLTRSRAV